MRKSVKRFLSTILALTMLCSCMVAMNVTAFAADYTEYGSVTTSTDLTTKTWDFSSNLSSSGVSCSAGDTVLGITVDSVGTFKIGTSSSPYISIKSAKFSIPVPEGSAGTITMSNQSNVSDRYLTLVDTNTTYSLSKDGQNYSFTAEDTTDGYLQFSETNSKEVKLQGIKVVVSNSVLFPEDTSVTYTITGSTNVPSTTITVGTYEVTTDEDGAYTITKSVESGANAPFADGDTFTVTATDYDSQTTTITVSGTDSTVFTASDVKLTKYELEALGNGKYESFTLPNFEPGSEFKSTVSDRSKFTGSMNFILDSAKEVSFAVKSGSSTATNTATFTLTDSSGNTIAEQADMAGGASAVTVTTYLEAGTYTIVGTSSATLQITSITVNPIAIFGITEEQAKSSSFNIVYGENNTTLLEDDEDTVYTGIDFDSGEKSASELISSAKYVIAYVVELSDGNSIDDLDISFNE